MVTPGNEMKWETTEPARGTFDFTAADAIVAFARAHGMRVRGHNLVWHSQLAGWVAGLPASSVKAVMDNHITREVTHFQGAIYAWDVVNEPFDDSGALRQDVFSAALGPGYIAEALRTAHAADPAARLYLNEYGIEGSGPKTDAMYALVSSLKQQGVPIDGVGFESHFLLGRVPADLASTMRRFTDLGLEVAVTELDDRAPLPATAANLALQAADYGAVVGACLSVPRCVGVSQWAVGDADSWIPGYFPGEGDATMYDSRYRPKPAYRAVVTALGGGTISGGVALRADTQAATPG
jgi:endo-1,4-beta-xylanase